MCITPDIHYIGVNDHDIDLFEGQYPVPRGMAYNSYVILDERVAVMDTVDGRFTGTWLENLSATLQGRRPDYLIVQHMEPDHAAGIPRFMDAYPEARIVASAKAFPMMQNFLGTEYEDRRIVVSQGDSLPLGVHTLHFVTAPMVHWPEVIVSYEDRDKVLFSADAFGKFGALDEEEPWEAEARRYYIGIVGKFGVQVQTLLKKAAALDIQRICPLHGPVLQEDLGKYLALYDTWSSYRPECKGVLIAYTSVYGGTRAAAEALKTLLDASGCPVKLLDLARCDMALAVSEAFRYEKLALATTTYNGGIFPVMREFLSQLAEHGYKDRTVGMIENGSWTPMAAKQMRGMLENCKGIDFVEPVVKLMSVFCASDRTALEALAEALG